jgi:hypothetical protein
VCECVCTCSCMSEKVISVRVKRRVRETTNVRRYCSFGSLGLKMSMNEIGEQERT